MKAELAMLASEADERLMAWFDAEMVKAEFVGAGLAEKLSTLQERGMILKELEELLGIVSEHPDEVVEWKSFPLLLAPHAGGRSCDLWLLRDLLGETRLQEVIDRVISLMEDGVYSRAEMRKIFAHDYDFDALAIKCLYGENIMPCHDLYPGGHGRAFRFFLGGLRIKPPRYPRSVSAPGCICG